MKQSLCMKPTENISPITFKAYKNENVVLDGTELIKTTWRKYDGNIYKAKIKRYQVIIRR